MKHLLYIAFLAYSLVAFSQPKKYEHETNNMVINLADATLKFQVPVSNPKVKVNNNLTYHWYKSNEILQTKGGYEGKLLHGDYSEFYLNKNLKTQGGFNKGLKHKEWKSWDDNGDLKEIINYKNGVLNGSFKTLDEKGRVILESNYKNGKLHGTTTSYADGKLLKRTTYKNGLEVMPNESTTKLEPTPIGEKEKKKFIIPKFWKKKDKEEKQGKPTDEKNSSEKDNSDKRI